MTSVTKLMPIESFQYVNAFAFDFDGTIAGRANGGDPKHAENVSEYVNYVLYAGVEEKLNALIDAGTLPIIVSNQFRVMNPMKWGIFMDVYERFHKKIMFLISTGNDKYRKPNIGLKTDYFPDVPLLGYCGDASGPTSDFPPFQWSSTDRDFATNIGVQFYEPSEVFQSNYATVSPTEPLIIMMGNQGSGKTTLAKRFAERENNVRYSQDECGPLKKASFIKEITAHLKQGKQVIVEATHSSSVNRQIWIDLANSLNKSWVIVWNVRDGRPFNARREKPVPAVAYATYSKYFNYPTENVLIVS